MLFFEDPVFLTSFLPPFLSFTRSLILFLVSPHRPKSTPTPTASLSANGVPTEAVDYDRLKQVNEHLDHGFKNFKILISSLHIIGGILYCLVPVCVSVRQNLFFV